jgi:hypothetical protein
VIGHADVRSAEREGEGGWTVSALGSSRAIGWASTQGDGGPAGLQHPLVSLLEREHRAGRRVGISARRLRVASA